MTSLCWYTAQGDFVCPKERLHNLKPQYIEDFSLEGQMRPAYVDDNAKMNACREMLSHYPYLPTTQRESLGKSQSRVQYFSAHCN